MYYSYVEIECIATSSSLARTDLAIKLLNCDYCLHLVTMGFVTITCVYDLQIFNFKSKVCQFLWIDF